MVRKTDVKRKMTKNSPLNRHAISGTIVKLLQLIVDVSEGSTEIVGSIKEYSIKEYPEKGEIKTDMTGQLFQNWGND